MYVKEFPVYVFLNTVNQGLENLVIFYLECSF